MNRVDEVLNGDWSKETSSVNIPWTCPTCPGSQLSERDENDLQILSSLHCRCKGRDCFVVGLRAERETHWQVLTYTDLRYLQRFQDISSVASDFTRWIAWRQARTNAKSLRPTSDKTPCRVKTLPGIRGTGSRTIRTKPLAGGCKPSCSKPTIIACFQLFSGYADEV